MLTDPSHPAIVKSLVWPAEAATQAFAQSLAGAPALRQAYIALSGQLGAGKTTLTRHLLRALGVQTRVKSPTYAMLEVYELPSLQIWHFDFYRLKTPQEWEDAGFRDLFASPGLKLAEWPDKANGLAPRADLSLTLEVAPDAARHVTLQAQTPIGVALLHAAT